MGDARSNIGVVFFPSRMMLLPAWTLTYLSLTIRTFFSIMKYKSWSLATRRGRYRGYDFVVKDRDWFVLKKKKSSLSLHCEQTFDVTKVYLKYSYTIRISSHKTCLKYPLAVRRLHSQGIFNLLWTSNTLSFL